MTQTKIELKASEHPQEEGQLIRSKEGIYRLMRRLQAKHTPLKLRFDSVADYYTSMVLGVDFQEGYVLLDEVFPNWGDELMTKAIPFRFSSFHDGCKIDASKMQAVGRAIKEGSPVYKVPFPQELFFLQRRQFFRATVRYSLEIKARLGVVKPEIVRDEYDNIVPQNPTWKHEGLLRDLSAQGCQIEVSGDVREQLPKNTEYASCHLIFPNGYLLDLGLAVRHVGYDENRNISGLGCQFLNMNPQLDRKISFIVNELQRDNTRSSTANVSAHVSELFQEPDIPEIKEKDKTEAEGKGKDKASNKSSKEAAKPKRASVAEVHQRAVACVEDLVISLRERKPLNMPETWKVAELLLEKLHQEREQLLIATRVRTAANYLYEHSVSVAVLLADQTLFDVENPKSRNDAYLKDLIFAGLCHDLGKGLIPVRIASKAGELTEQEAKIMHKHSLLTREILSRQQGAPDLALILATENCERLDGSGHPKGLKGLSLSPVGKLAAVIDVFDAMTNGRSYRAGLPFALAYKRLLALHHQLELSSVQQLIKRQGLFPLGSLVAFENGDLGFVKQQDASYQPEVVRLVYNKFSQQALEPKDLLVSSLEPEQKKLLPEDPAKYHLDNSVLLHKLN